MRRILRVNPSKRSIKHLSHLSPYLMRPVASRPTLLTLSAFGIGALSYTLLSRRNSSFSSAPSSSMSQLTGSQAPTFPTRQYTPRHNQWPYTEKDMTPLDPSSDIDFYSAPRFVTHIDDHAIGLLRQYYGSVLPTPGTTAATRPRVLDLCSSWISHYPSPLTHSAHSGKDTGLAITGLGMNARELAANPLFNPSRSESSRQQRWAVKDMNVDPTVPQLSELFDDDREGIEATTLTVSIDYLTRPVAVLQSLLSRTKEGGTVHLAISNRCFPTKAVGRWLRISEEERLQMVGDYLHFAGWNDVEVVELSNGMLEGEEGGEVEQSQGGALGKFFAGMGLGGMGAGGRCDPLWVVRAKKVSGSGDGGAAL